MPKLVEILVLQDQNESKFWFLRSKCIKILVYEVKMYQNSRTVPKLVEILVFQDENESKFWSDVEIVQFLWF